MKYPTLTALFAGACMSVTGCSHKSIRSDQTVSDSKITAPSLTRNLDLEMAHFGYNSSVLTKTGKKVLRADAEALKTDPILKIQAQGFCDDRGSVQYNMALGERRALSVKAYLQKLGISGDRITTASLGKSHPLDSRENEQAWALNRRASFVVQSSNKVVALR